MPPLPVTVRVGGYVTECHAANQGDRPPVRRCINPHPGCIVYHVEPAATITIHVVRQGDNRALHGSPPLARADQSSEQWPSSTRPILRKSRFTATQSPLRFRGYMDGRHRWTPFRADRATRGPLNGFPGRWSGFFVPMISPSGRSQSCGPSYTGHASPARHRTGRGGVTLRQKVALRGPLRRCIGSIFWLYVRPPFAWAAWHRGLHSYRK